MQLQYCKPGILPTIDGTSIICDRYYLHDCDMPTPLTCSAAPFHETLYAPRRLCHAAAKKIKTNPLSALERGKRTSFDAVRLLLGLTLSIGRVTGSDPWYTTAIYRAGGHKPGYKMPGPPRARFELAAWSVFPFRRLASRPLG